MYLQPSVSDTPRQQQASKARHVQRVDDAGNVTENGQQDGDDEVGAAAALEEDTQRRQDDGEDDLDDVAAQEEQRQRVRLEGP